MRGFRHSCAAAVMGMTVAVVAIPSVVDAQHVPDIPERAHGADRIVVASIREVHADYQRNEWGDELIVSHAALAVEEALKGDRPTELVVDVEGGTVNGVTLSVSTLPHVKRGERAVFFLTRGKTGGYTPYLRGYGILKLDASDTVAGSSLTLQDIRRMSRQ
jgi:hypothetical protein